jgi:YbgC/YbaW family acyl-CoA thioester hydrolase
MTAPTASLAGSDHRVPPRLCDAQGMVHAARYLEVVEDAFLDWLDAIGYPYSDLVGSGIDLVIGRSTIRHLGPARLGDVLHVTVEHLGSNRSTATIRFTISRGERGPVAVAEVTYVAVQHGSAAPLPAALSGDGRLTDEELVRQLTDAQREFYAGGAARPLEALLHPDVEWHVPGSSAVAGSYAGRDAVLDYMRRRRELAHNTFRIHRTEVLLGPSRFASVATGTAVIGDREQTWDTIGLYRRRGNQISECFLIPLDQQAFDRVWTPA